MKAEVKRINSQGRIVLPKEWWAKWENEILMVELDDRIELENAITQLKVMMRESIPISKSTLGELRVLLHKVEMEVEER